MKSPIVKTCFTILFSFFIIYSPAQTSWNLGGNSSSNPSENIGSSSMTDLKFITDNQFRMNLTKTGRLGLNTNDPNAFFEVEYCLPAAANDGGMILFLRMIISL